MNPKLRGRVFKGGERPLRTGLQFRSEAHADSSTTLRGREGGPGVKAVRAVLPILEDKKRLQVERRDKESRGRERKPGEWKGRVNSQSKKDVKVRRHGPQKKEKR